MFEILSWILQIIVAIFFIKPAFDNLLLSPETLIQKHQLKPGNSVWINRILGLFQILGVLGLILPKMLSLYPILTPIAALGFCLMMLGAVMVHKNDKEKKLLFIVIIVALISFGIVILNKKYFL